MAFEEPSIEQDGIGITVRGRGPVSKKQAADIIDQIIRIVTTPGADAEITSEKKEKDH